MQKYNLSYGGHHPDLESRMGDRISTVNIPESIQPVKDFG